ncbi:MAG: response regulator [Candidatus Bathyarchaeota archaeon]
MPDHGPPLRVLFVDNDPMFLALLKPMIRSFDSGIEVATLDDPNKVLEAVVSGRYDCVVVDYYMPRVSGVSLIKRIKAARSVPCILYTGMSIEDVLEEAEEAGVDAVICKVDDPGQYVQFIRLIRDTVDKHSSALARESLYTQTAIPVDPGASSNQP